VHRLSSGVYDELCYTHPSRLVHLITDAWQLAQHAGRHTLLLRDLELAYTIHKFRISGMGGFYHASSDVCDDLYGTQSDLAARLLTHAWQVAQLFGRSAVTRKDLAFVRLIHEINEDHAHL
jgi:histone H3/H4